MREPEAIVLGAGPAGPGAALALAREGAPVVLVVAGAEPGGLCVTLSLIHTPEPTSPY